ncbi:hypothetical protein C5167_046396 [Papaver somniferum]|uniref:Uncharacterized protein n=1 Tax=Papaver somniferum TaxID=3469 RepID=A0A4Y7LG42_PAPSO|nr:hypothetical protein C5167_046396 [Papaver somniferum]
MTKSCGRKRKREDSNVGGDAKRRIVIWGETEEDWELDEIVTEDEIEAKKLAESFKGLCEVIKEVLGDRVTEVIANPYPEFFEKQHFIYQY